jgi:hypothetical protein
MARDGHVVPADPGASVVAKMKGQWARSWMSIDCTGERIGLDVDKYAIMRRVHIHARDLRILDPLLSYPSTILGRDKAIVLNLEVSSLSLLFWFFWFFFFFFNALGLIGFCLQFLCAQHIKAIITAEEVTLSLSISKLWKSTFL